MMMFYVNRERSDPDFNCGPTEYSEDPILIVHPLSKLARRISNYRLNSTPKIHDEDGLEGARRCFVREGIEDSTWND